MKRIIVVGIGNLILKDEGVGIHVIRQLETMGLPPDIELIDGGTNSYDLLDFFCESDISIVVDAMQAGGEPGTIYRAPLDELGLKPNDQIKSLHEMHFIEAVEMVRMLGSNPEFLVFGIEPKSIELGLELTPEVAAKVPRVAELIKEEIERLRQ